MICLVSQRSNRWEMFRKKTKQLYQYCVGSSSREGPLHMLLIKSYILFLKQSSPDSDWGPSTGLSEQDRHSRGLTWLVGGGLSEITPPTEAWPCYLREAWWLEVCWSHLCPVPSPEARQPALQQSLNRFALSLSSSDCDFLSKQKVLPSRLGGWGMVSEKSCLDLSRWFAGKRKQNGKGDWCWLARSTWTPLDVDILVLSRQTSGTSFLGLPALVFPSFPASLLSKTVGVFQLRTSPPQFCLCVSLSSPSAWTHVPPSPFHHHVWPSR